jgi:uncharacterized protein
MDRKYWLLMALDIASATGLTPAQLQKVLFLLGQETPQWLGTQDFYNFVPYNYGPFSKSVYVDAEVLAQAGMVNIRKIPGVSFSVYEITASGIERAKILEREADARALQYLRSVVPWAQRLTFSELISSIYRKYPAFRVNSVFQD